MTDPRDRLAAAPDACTALVALAAREAAERPAPRRFVRRLALAGAGVRPGLVGLFDLARAGDNRLPGRGFKASLDDGTDGQVRHFCGIAAACDRFGSRVTWWLSVHVRRDPPDSPDGRVTDLAIAFVERLYGGELDVAEAPDWLRRELCAAGERAASDDTAPVERPPS